MKIIIDIYSAKDNKRCADDFSDLTKRCDYLGTVKFGSVPVCRLFPSDVDAYTILNLDNNDCVLRCNDCLKKST